MNGSGFLRCDAGDRAFALRAEDVCHVARADQLRVDRGTDGRAGVVMLGGQAVPVFSLRTSLGLAEIDAAPRTDRHIAVTGSPHNLIGWMVDHLARYPATDADVRSMPRCVGHRAIRWFEGIVATAGAPPLLLISPNALNPLTTPAISDEECTRGFAAPQAASAANGAGPLALVFSTPALPMRDGWRYALSGRQVAAIVQPEATLTIPGSAPHVMGVTMWRDAAVPVFDFRASSPRAVEPRARRLIARCGSARRATHVAFEIEADILVHRPVAGDRRLEDVGVPSFASGVFDINGSTVALLDIDALVDAA